MKKALILAFDFPPHTSIGAQRPYGWANYLARYQIHPTVVTRQWEAIQDAVDYVKPVGQEVKIHKEEHCTVYAVPFKPNFRDRWLLKYGYAQLKWLRKIASLWIQLTQFSTNRWDATSPIYEQALALVKTERFDVIIATGEPFVLFKHAAQLSKKTGIPWVADYRDCWTNNLQVMASKPPQRWLHTCYFRFFEKKIVRTARLITTAAPSYQAALRELFKKQPIAVVYNGSDPKQLAPLADEQAPVFTLSYAGIFYPHQALEMFLQGLAQFKHEFPKAQWKLIFYGLLYYPEMCERVKKASRVIDEHILFTERLPYPELMQQLARSHVQVLLSALGSNWLNAKVFDYLEVGRPILLCQNDKGILSEIIFKMNAGKVCDNADEVAQLVSAYYKAWQVQPQTNRLRPAHNPYTREEQAGVLAQFLFQHILETTPKV